MMKNARVVAFSGVIAALSVVFIFLGTVIYPLAYVAPIISGACLISAIRSINVKSALLIYCTVSIITILFMPDKECTLTYVFFFGYYPIIKPRLDMLKSKAARLLLKLLIFNTGIITSQLICFYIFGIPFDNFLGKWGIVILLLLANLALALYDRMMIAFDILYMKRLYNKVKYLIK